MLLRNISGTRESVQNFNLVQLLFSCYGLPLDAPNHLRNFTVVLQLAKVAVPQT